ncbi:MAG: NAD-dependent epimerase/dehydratase family protein [Terrimicrobiaceae bacterium]|nr:NAD-dependent epimerase/dehydratase family protein [Terrimicrobiaceae bacterium]
MKVVVTGGAGFIGSHLVAHYQGRADITVLDNLRTGRRSNLEGLECRFLEGDIRDLKSVREALEGADLVFHLAALVSVPESMERPVETAAINVAGLLNVLEAARAAGARKLVFASSAAVYGEAPGQPKIESQPPDPRSPYALTKLDGEFWCAHYSRQGWLPTACLRFFNVFGPRQDPASPYAAAVPIFLEKARRGEPLTIFGDGGQTRDFIYVKDIAGALAFCAETEGVQGVFNAGYGGSTTVLELAREILRLTGSSSRIEFAPPRPGDIRHSTADASRLRAAGWQPRYDFSSGLAEMLSSNRP